MSRTRFNLEIATRTYKNLQNIAEQEETTVADLLRRATKLILFVRSIRDDPGTRLLIERGVETQEIVVDLI
jgi:hypothetical protein